MAFTLSRVDRVYWETTLATVLPDVDPATVAGVDVGLVPLTGAPTAATVWTAASYADGVVTILLAGPDADSSGALVVPADCDMWLRGTDTPEVEAAFAGRLAVRDSRGVAFAAGALLPLLSVQGRTGAVVLSAADVGADAAGAAAAAQAAAVTAAATDATAKAGAAQTAAAADATTKANAAQAAAVAAIPSMSTIAAASELRAAYVALGQLAASPDLMAVGTITRSATGSATGFAVAWPDGATGTFAGTESTASPGAIDSYTVTHVASGVTTTYTQPALTRDSSGNVTARPAITVS